MAAAGPYRPQLVFVDGTKPELIQEMASYLQIGDDVKPLLEKDQVEEALTKVVKASIFLNSVPEKDFTAAYNLLVYLALQSDEPKRHLPAICQNLTKPVTSSPQNGPQMALFALTTIFNLLQPSDAVRFNVLIQIVRFYKINSLPVSEHLKAALKNLPRWIEAWDLDEDDARKIYLETVDVMSSAGEEEQAYQYLIKALGTFDGEDQEEYASEEAQQLALRAVRMAISSPNRLSFEELRPVPAVSALSESHPAHYQLLEIFCEQDLDDYDDFREEHEGFIEKEKLDNDVLYRKMRLLTFASLAAANTNTREISYRDISKALQIPGEEVEMWAIDVIRAGLVEGKLSQNKQTFLIHSVKYRVFGEKQWRQVASSLAMTRKTVGGLLTTLRKEQANAIQEQERKINEANNPPQEGGRGDRGGNRRGGRGGQGHHQSERRQRTEDDE